MTGPTPSPTRNSCPPPTPGPLYAAPGLLLCQWEPQGPLPQQELKSPFSCVHLAKHQATPSFLSSGWVGQAGASSRLAPNSHCSKSTTFSTPPQSPLLCFREPPAPAAATAPIPHPFWFQGGALHLHLGGGSGDLEISAGNHLRLVCLTTKSSLEFAPSLCGHSPSQQSQSAAWARLLVTHVCADFPALTPATRRSGCRVGLGPALAHKQHLAARTSRGGTGGGLSGACRTPHLPLNSHSGVRFWGTFPA